MIWWYLLLEFELPLRQVWNLFDEETVYRVIYRGSPGITVRISVARS